MVRSPAAASRKRRIDSSSEELEEVHHASPRRSKLRKVSVPSPESSSSPQGGEGDSHLRAVSVSAASNSSSHAASQEGNEHEGSSEEDAEYQEKLQLWEMFADEYHDSELPSSFLAYAARPVYSVPGCDSVSAKGQHGQADPFAHRIRRHSQSSENSPESFSAASNSCLSMMSRCGVSLSTSSSSPAFAGSQHVAGDWRGTLPRSSLFAVQ